MIFFIIGALFFFGTLLVLFLMNWYKQNYKSDGKLPPYSRSSMLENIKATMITKGLGQLDHDLKLSRLIEPGGHGWSPHGVTFLLAVPQLEPWIITTDYRLARMVLHGATSSVVEGEKHPLMKLFNFVDRDTNSILTHSTANIDREDARKTLANSFSNTNLQKTWPLVQQVLADQLAQFRALSEKPTSGNSETAVVEMKETIFRFFFAALLTASFGVKVNMDGEERDDSINGLAYIEEQTIASVERAKEILMPFRPHWFWDREVLRARKACQNIAKISEKILMLHARSVDVGGGSTTHSAENGLSTASTPSGSSRSTMSQTLMESLCRHAYPSHLARLSDVNIMTVAGHETSAATFSFLLLEIARHPAAKSKLQKELATVMPRHPPGTLPAGSHMDMRSSVQEEQEQPVQMEHGDKSLISAIYGLEYLNMCIKEVMRLWPVAAGGPARLLVEDVHYNNMFLPKGSTFIAHFYSMFRANWIDRAEEFVPERWSDDNPQLPELKEMFMPFSLGKRSCIGQNMAQFQLRMMAAYFLHYFDFELVGEPTYEYFLTLKPDEMMMRVRTRHH